MPNFFELEDGTGYLLLEHGNGYLLSEPGLLTKQQIIDAAVQIAGGVGGDVQLSPLADSEMTAEDLFPLAFRYVIKEFSAMEGGFQDVAREFEITVAVNGTDLVGNAPADLVTGDLSMAFLPDYEFSSKSENLMDYKRQSFSNLLCYWLIHNGRFVTTCGASDPTPPTTVKLFGPSVPAIPDSPSTSLDITGEVADRLIYVLALALKGEIRL